MTSQVPELELGAPETLAGKEAAPRSTRRLLAFSAAAIALVATAAAAVALTRPGREKALPAPSSPAPAPHPVAVDAVEGRYDTVDQDGARIPADGEVRLYFVGGSNVAWQTWPDQLHSYLRKLNFTVPEENYSHADLTFPEELAPVCDDEAEFQALRTPRIARPGWGSWGFAYDSRDDCTASPFLGTATGEYPFRTIAGQAVSCFNGWACDPHGEQRLGLARPADIVEDAGRADVVLLSTWVNDFKQQYCSYQCYNGTELDPAAIAPVSVETLRRLIRAIHKASPAAFVVVIALYPDAQQTLLVEETLGKIAAINAAVREGVSTEPNVAFVDFELAPGQDMFQVKPPGHPNCRGDRIMATQVLRALFDRKVLGRTLALPEGDRAGECLRAASCGDIAEKACCQAAAICRVDPDGNCVAYSPGVGAMT